MVLPPQMRVQAELGDKSADFFVTVGGVPTWRDSQDIDTRGEWAVAGRGTTAMWSYQIAAFFKLSENQKEMPLNLWAE